MAQIAGAAIRNRIIEIIDIRLGDVLPHGDNPKLHPDKQRKALRAEVRNLGWAGVPLAYHSERNGGALTWCDGHMRASEFPDLVARVAVTDYTDSEVDQLLPVYDFIGTMSKTIKTSAEALINRTPSKSVELAAVQASFAESSNLSMPTLASVHAAANQAPDPADSPIGRLIKWPRWNKKNDGCFLSLRSWRRTTHRIDLETFKAVKANPTREIIEGVAAEICERLTLTLRNPKGAGAWITSPPRGHSKRSSPHFAAEIAKAVALLLDLPYYRVFIDQDLPGSSSPKTYHQRQAAYIDPGAVFPSTGLVIIVDDIATTGTTFGACQNALGSHGYATLGIAWLCEITEEF